MIHVKNQPNSGERGIINSEKAMEETDTRVARWAEGKQSLSRLSLTKFSASPSSPAASPLHSSAGRDVPRARRAHTAVPAPTNDAALP